MIYLAIAVIIAASVVIYFAGKYFADASSNLGDYFRLPRSVKGATFDAISSSFPELMVALFSVIAFKQFEVGIGTITGSALFNLLIIPGICVLVAPKVFKVSKDVVNRDVKFYLFSVILLLFALIFFKWWGLLVAFAFIALYLLYIRSIVIHTKEFRSDKKVKKKVIPLGKNILIAFVTMLAIAIASYFLTEYAIELASALGVSPLIIAFTVIAVATSIPDAVISIVNARKGDIDDAASNVFGSNIFDILIGLSIPLLIAYIFAGPTLMASGSVGVVIGLLLSTILVMSMLRKQVLTRRNGWVLLAVYLVFVLTVIFI
jgi:cation:H+ antiporter